MHYERVRNWGETGPPEPVRIEARPHYIDANGYRRLNINGRTVLEHRHVMEQKLGRSLLKTEHCHHLNGDRLDNRIENIELWTKMHPAGQRVVDKVNFAIEMLLLYPELGRELGYELVEEPHEPTADPPAPNP